MAPDQGGGDDDGAPGPFTGGAHADRHGPLGGIVVAGDDQVSASSCPGVVVASRGRSAGLRPSAGIMPRGLIGDPTPPDLASGARHRGYAVHSRRTLGGSGHPGPLIRKKSRRSSALSVVELRGFRPWPSHCEGDSSRSGPFAWYFPVAGVARRVHAEPGRMPAWGWRRRAAPRHVGAALRTSGNPSPRVGCLNSRPPVRLSRDGMCVTAPTRRMSHSHRVEVVRSAFLRRRDAHVSALQYPGPIGAPVVDTHVGVVGHGHLEVSPGSTTTRPPSCQRPPACVISPTWSS